MRKLDFFRILGTMERMPILLPHVLQHESMCGVATLKMLLSQQKKYPHQKHLAYAICPPIYVQQYGMSPSQLAQSLAEYTSEIVFFIKKNATCDDIALCIRQGIAVGIEWQGIWTTEEMDGDTDYGHYSAVTQISLRQKKLTIQDPDICYVRKPHHLSFQEFLPRWWDVNRDRRDQKDQQCMFILLRDDQRIVLPLGMHRLDR